MPDIIERFKLSPAFVFVEAESNRIALRDISLTSNNSFSYVFYEENFQGPRPSVKREGRGGANEAGERMKPDVVAVKCVPTARICVYVYMCV